MIASVSRHKKWWCVEWQSPKGLCQMLFTNPVRAQLYAQAVERSDYETMRELEKKRLAYKAPNKTLRRIRERIEERRKRGRKD
jgi:hypothetical protein